MIVIAFVALALSAVLAAAPWRAPTQFISISHTYLLLAAALVELSVLHVHKPVSGPLIGLLLVGVWTYRNRHLPGARLLMIGLIANGLAMSSHGGAMPLAPSAAHALHLNAESHTLLANSKDVIGTPGIWLWLSDWIILRTPLIRLVASPGDVSIFFALMRWVWACRSAITPRTQNSLSTNWTALA